jgi:hypothetical protein
MDPRDSLEMKQRARSQEAPIRKPTTPDQASNGVWPLHRYSVVDGGDIVGIMQRNGEMVRIPAWTVIGDHLILGAHPADTMPPNVDAIAFPTASSICTLHTAMRMRSPTQPTFTLLRAF